MYLSSTVSIFVGQPLATDDFSPASIRPGGGAWPAKDGRSPVKAQEKVRHATFDLQIPEQFKGDLMINSAKVFFLVVASCIMRPR